MSASSGEKSATLSLLRRTPVRLTRSSRPAISVVVASTQSESKLDECLNTLRPQCAREGVELLVVRADASPRIASLRRAHSDVRFVAAPAGSTVAELRVVGTYQASGDIIAVIDDARPVDDQLVHVLATGIASHRPDDAGGR